MPCNLREWINGISSHNTFIEMDVFPVAWNLSVNSSVCRTARNVFIVLMFRGMRSFGSSLTWPLLYALWKLQWLMLRCIPACIWPALFVHSTAIDMQIHWAAAFFFSPLPTLTVPVSDQLMDLDTKPLNLEGCLWTYRASDLSMREERRGEEVRVGEEGSLGMMPAFRTVKLRRKSCALGRRTKSQARAVWRILYRLVFRVSAWVQFCITALEVWRPDATALFL